jgi:hypothetical protein
MEFWSSVMSKDSDDCEVMNELFNGDDLPYVNHWRPVAIIENEKRRELTDEEKLEWIKKQRIIMDKR